MEKKISMVLSVVIFFCSADCFAEKRDFRNVSWGMSRLEVMANEENAPDSFGIDYLYFRPEIEGRKFYLIYEFVENRLTNAEYLFTAHDRTDYLWLKRLVEMKYGRPLVSFDGGADNYKFKWKNAYTEIALAPGRERECRVTYTGKKYQYLKKKRAKAVSLSKVKAANNTF